ncbi:hypothetical protein [Tardiphaga sp. 619_E2_N8_5]|uniref:hypothetical protein n=1 Tax=unclassified Tardiphaga TaxID=2631404 RepID=UPI003F238E16
MLKALQGDDKWGKLLWEWGYGKVPDNVVVGGDSEKQVEHTFTLRLYNSQLRPA